MKKTLSLNIFGVKMSFNLQTLLLGMILGVLICRNMINGCCCGNGIEGFSELDEQHMDGVDGSYVNGTQSEVGDTKMSSETYTSPEKPLSGLNFFAQNKTSPHCTNATYSTSSGGICLTSEQIDFLNTRGGNSFCHEF